MKYRTLGKTNIKVSEVGLGGEYFSEVDQPMANQMMDVAIENGINIIDVYMPCPDTRTRIGDALLNRRDKMIIQGHIGAIYENGQYLRTRDLQKAKQGVEDFLTRFHTDYIDIGMLHYVDEMADWQEVIDNGILDYMIEQKQKGVFKTLGVSSHNPEVAIEMVSSGHIDVLMFSISPLFDLVLQDMDHFFEMPEEEAYPTALTIDKSRSKLYALCKEKGVAITVMKALAAGSLLDPKDTPFKDAMTVPQCIHYALNRPAVSSVLVGVKSIQEIKEAVAYTSQTSEQLDYTHILAGNEGLTKKCMYCNHCLPCIQHIDVAAITRLLDEARNKGYTSLLQEQYNQLKVKASSCIKCGQCMTRCPFGIDIITNMEEATQIFENKQQ